MHRKKGYISRYLPDEVSGGGGGSCSGLRQTRCLSLPEASLRTFQARSLTFVPFQVLLAGLASRALTSDCHTHL